MCHAFFTNREYLPFQSPKAMSILITNDTLHQLNVILPFLATKIS